MRYCLLIIGGFFFLNGCYKVGHEDSLNFKNAKIGKKATVNKPFKFKNAGKLYRSDFVITGQGFTHITKRKNGNLLYHWDSQEILANFKGNKEWIGKCKYYYIVDSKTYIVKGWGFEKDANPLSCRTWS